MRINSLVLETASLEIQRNFYRNVLDLPVELAGEGLRIQAGWTELTFTASNTPVLYHFAFNIPANQFDAAMKWTAARTEILPDRAGEKVFPSKTWNSTSLYFKDPAGNILEFIARHDLPNSASEPFGGGRILCVSEIGLATEDVPDLVDRLQDELGLSSFQGERSDTFTAVGDDEGLFVVVKQGRIWKPDTGVPAELLSLRVSGETGGRLFRLDGFPYRIS
jgi:catechol-2,3-dioxygenase